MLKYIGAAVLFFLAFSFSREYRRHSERRLLEGEAALAFMKALRREVSCFLRPISEWAKEYSDAVFLQTGIIEPLCRGASLGEAYELSEGNFSMSRDAKACLRSFCKSFGRGYLEDELRALDSHLDELSSLLLAEREDFRKNCRLVGTLSAAASFAIVILLI